MSDPSSQQMVITKGSGAMGAGCGAKGSEQKRVDKIASCAPDADQMFVAKGAGAMGIGGGAKGSEQARVDKIASCAPDASQMFVKKAPVAQGFSASELRGGRPAESAGGHKEVKDKVGDVHNFGALRAGLKKTGGPKVQDEALVRQKHQNSIAAPQPSRAPAAPRQVSAGLKDRMAAFQQA